MSEKCTARIKNQHDDEHCVFEAGHQDPEYGTDHGGPQHPVMGRLRWNDSAVGAVPHQPSGQTATEATELEGDDPEVLRKRAEDAEALLKRYVDLAEVTHKYRIMGGHDSIGENHSCAGCALARQAREHLEQYR
ncbi:hypothetical protein [Streptomyces sp. NPDC007991]|uniref:hypothetical protein n=1 Tax=Streptomyces sp. NPDC007991 TaxID=3364803 RepID=UPI0036EBF14D